VNNAVPMKFSTLSRDYYFANDAELHRAVIKVNKKLSCRSQAAGASCKVIRNYTDEYDVCVDRPIST